MLTCQKEKQHIYRVISTFNLRANPNGRLSAIRRLSLNLTIDTEHTFVLMPANRAVPSRRMIVHEWGSLLHQDPRGILRFDFIEFPMLEFLSLDFSDWHLGNNEGLVVSRGSRSTQADAHLFCCRFVRSLTSFVPLKGSENWLREV